MTDFERLAELEHARRAFALATVVARRSPVSSHVGDRALVFPDGTLEGFVGGSCSRDIVRREALRAAHRRTAAGPDPARSERRTGTDER